MNSLLVSAGIVLVCLFYTAVAWPYEADDFSSWKLTRPSRRSHRCTGVGEKCYSTGQCCRGFVCATFDDYFGSQPNTEGQNPEVPGFCVKEKDLKPCYSSSECPSRGQCVNLGRGGETYCINRNEHSYVEEEEQELAKAIENAIETPTPQRFTSGGTGRLGTTCASSAECQSFHKTGQEMCCQRVKRGRQGTKTICDLVTEISKCI